MNETSQTRNAEQSIWLRELAESVRLREGVEGITRGLWALYRGDIFTTHDWSRELRIPVPVLAALRRELEKRDILIPGRGLRLTEAGTARLEELFGRRKRPGETLKASQGASFDIPPEAYPALEEFTEACLERPAPDMALDQSHATPETGIKRALLLMEKGLLGEPLLFLGDDDFTSMACWILRRLFFEEPSRMGRLTALDVDERYLAVLEELSRGEIETVRHDVRDEMPSTLRNRFAAVITDPAYTANAIVVFAQRAAQAARDDGRLFLSMPDPDRQTLGSIQLAWLGMGWATREIRPRFNEYIGASIHAHVSTLFTLERFTPSSPEIQVELRYTPFYTGDVRAPGGLYECAACETIHAVGPSQDYNTIQTLKAVGCRECGADIFRRTGNLNPNT